MFEDIQLVTVEIIREFTDILFIPIKEKDTEGAFLRDSVLNHQQRCEYLRSRKFVLTVMT
jgi:hypothetical protein